MVTHRKKFFEFYDLLETVGEGAFGKVSKCRHKASGVTRAVKQIKKNLMHKTQEQSFLNEVNLLEQLDHPGIVRLFEVFTDNANYFFVTELCSGGELFDEIVKRQCFTEVDAHSIMF